MVAVQGYWGLGGSEGLGCSGVQLDGRWSRDGGV